MWDVRTEEPEDFAAVRVVHELAFAPSREELELVDALRAAGVHVPELCLVALHEDALVGHIMFSRARLDSGDPLLALAPMGVVPDRQRRGVGTALISEALRRAASTDFPLVVVVGHAAYYPRFGFERGDAVGIEAPFPVAPEAWMAHRLPAYRNALRGTVVYPEPFGL